MYVDLCGSGSMSNNQSASGCCNSDEVGFNVYVNDDDDDFVTPREMFGDNNHSDGIRCTNKKNQSNWAEKLLLIKMNAI